MSPAISANTLASSMRLLNSGDSEGLPVQAPNSSIGASGTLVGPDRSRNRIQHVKRHRTPWMRPCR
eukprot:15025753-Alexandrium_andersonii.AAC.1